DPFACLVSSVMTSGRQSSSRPLDHVRRLEPPLDAGGNAGQNRAHAAMRLGERAARSRKAVVAIGGTAVAARTQVIMGVGSVEGYRHGGVPGQILAKFVLIGRG